MPAASKIFQPVKIEERRMAVGFRPWRQARQPDCTLTAW